MVYLHDLRGILRIIQSYLSYLSMGKTFSFRDFHRASEWANRAIGDMGGLNSFARSTLALRSSGVVVLNNGFFVKKRHLVGLANFHDFRGSRNG